MKLINTGINQSMKQWTLNTIYRCVGNKDMSNCLQSSSTWTFLQRSTQQITRLSCLSSWILEFVAQPGNSLLLTWRDGHHASCRRSAGVPQGWMLGSLPFFLYTILLVRSYPHVGFHTTAMWMMLNSCSPFLRQTLMFLLRSQHVLQTSLQIAVHQLKLNPS